MPPDTSAAAMQRVDKRSGDDCIGENGYAHARRVDPLWFLLGSQRILEGYTYRLVGVVQSRMEESV